MVTFTYVDAGVGTSSNFASHLAAYEPLFRQLISFRFVYIAAKEGYLRGVGERFRGIVKRPVEADVADEIRRYFQIRQKWDNNEYVIPVPPPLTPCVMQRTQTNRKNVQSIRTVTYIGGGAYVIIFAH